MPLPPELTSGRTFDAAPETCDHAGERIAVSGMDVCGDCGGYLGTADEEEVA